VKPVKTGRQANRELTDSLSRSESINDTIMTYAVEPFTNIHGIEFVLDKRYSTLTLTETV
jgi:hypothetical protein